VIAQATGFDRFLPTGSGLFSFETEEDALDALFAIQSDYHRHAAAARDIAEQHFASSRVLTRILEAVGFPA
jgi:hypothetical protein